VEAGECPERASCFSFAGQFYEGIDDVAMGSPLSPFITSFFMEDFEEMALDQPSHKPLCWFCYLDDTFIIWPHGPERLRDFLDHLNSAHHNSHFTMETERDGHLPFLDIDIYRRADSSLGHKVYCKPTHTNLNVNDSCHHTHPTSILRQNGYTDQQIHRALNPPLMVAWPNEKPDSVAFLPYNSINRVVYITVISTNKNKLILMYQHLFIGQRCFTTCFDLYKVIIRPVYKNSILVLELCYLIWIHIITIYFILIANTTFLLIIM
jgi:multisubunit Na+/H+ antiporter MnhF subunit